MQLPYRLRSAPLAIAFSLALSQAGPALAATPRLARQAVATNPYTYSVLAPQTVRPMYVSHAAMIAVSAADIRTQSHVDATPPSRAARFGVNAATYASLKAGARYIRPGGASNVDVLGAFSAAGSNSPFASQFEGLANSGITCGFFGAGGCQPPDQALAASTTAVVQAVNTSVAVYNPGSGAMRLGWPLDFNAFLGGAPGAKVKNCSPYGAFTSDPRAFYDVNDQRFFVSFVQLDAPGFSGPKDTCANLSIVWIGVSVDANPDDGFYAIGLDASEGGVSLADYPRLGFDANTVEVSTNSFSYATGNYTTAPMFYLSKYDLENGRLTTSSGYAVSINGRPLDTVQPVETLAGLNAQPGVLYNVAAFDFFFGGGECSTGCKNLSLFAFANPLSPKPTFLYTQVATPAYTLAPNADSEFQAGSIETLDTRISATPTYVATATGGGAISWALETGQSNATQTVPAILWGIIDTAPTKGNPVMNFAGKTRTTGYVVGSKDIANSFAATMLSDGGSHLTIAADVMGTSLYPAQVVYTVATGGTLRGPYLLHRGIAPDIIDSRYGDYSATSFDGSNVWVAGQYIGGSSDWATAFGKVGTY